MKLRGYTDSDDYTVRTLFRMAMDRHLWHFGIYWRDWRLQWLYSWYDGPIFQLYVGPLCINLAYWD